MDMSQILATQQPQCAICGTTQKLLRCAKCKTTYYCSPTHQHIDWPAHKQECRLLTHLKSSNKSQQLTNDSSDMDAMDSSPSQRVLSAVQPLSVILGTNENEILHSQAESVSQHSNVSGYYGNVDANSTTIEQMQFHSGLPDSDCNSLILNSHFDKEELQLQLQQRHQHGQQTYQPALPQFSNHSIDQHEKSSSYQINITAPDENVIENVNERRYEELCRSIINDMNQYGLSVVDDFLGMEKGLQILNEVHRMYAAGMFQDGQLVNKLRTEQDLRMIRGDKITWVKGVEPGCSNVGYLINQIDAVICRANTMKNNGKFGNYNIKERTKAMVACYPGSGSHYVMHVDNPNKDGRVITAIYYLNVNWDTKRSGGVLRIFPEQTKSVADIEPKFDRLIFFWSDKRNPHEVQPAHRTRYAVTVWYFDANEREAALNRCKNTAANSTANNGERETNALERTTSTDTMGISETTSPLPHAQTNGNTSSNALSLNQNLRNPSEIYTT